MPQRKARKKSTASNPKSDADQNPRPKIFGDIGEVTDAELPPGMPPEFRQHLLTFRCGLNDGPILDGEVPGAFSFATIMSFFESYIDSFESQLSLINSCWEMHINRRFALAGSLYEQWLEATALYCQCLESALDLIVRSNPAAANQVMQLRETFRKGPSLAAGEVRGIAHLRQVIATVLTLASAHKDVLPWGGYFEAIKNDSGKIIQRQWRWCKPMVQPNEDYNRTTSLESVRESQEADAARHFEMLNQMQRDIVQALFEKQVMGANAAMRPSQETVAQWVGCKCNSAFKAALAGLRPARFVDNGRHHGRQGGYFLLDEVNEFCKKQFGQV